MAFLLSYSWIQALFGDKLSFLPLMMISVYGAIGVLICHIWLILLVFDDDVMIAFKKKRCELIEVCHLENNVMPQ